MRLISAHIKGHGRLVDSKINLDAKVIAIVGPNEAGKTTLLNALAHVDAGGELNPAGRSRATTVDDWTTVTEFTYVLDETDHEALADLDLHELPRRMRVGRTAAGDKLFVTPTPSPRKSVKPLEEFLHQLKGAAASSDLDEWIDSATVYADPHSDEARDYRAELATVLSAVEAAITEPGTTLGEEPLELAKSLRSVTLDEADSQGLIDSLDGTIAWAEREDPAPATRDRLWKRTPDFIPFNEDDRSIQSAYTLDDALIENVPPALENLVGTADLDLSELWHFIQTGDIARRDTAIRQANTRMNAIFKDAWKQSRLSVQFSVDGPQLRVLLWEDGDNITVFDERSAGLRTFVALIAFLKVHGSDRPPVLLIDEAENHLHIDAQADLVNMFVTQEHAVKVIYTTHSPACLPPDLGSGIRTVVPRTDNFQVSDVKNSFWQGSAGFSPLMLAMGAGAAAFTPARCVVLAEGATEMILLPTLIRAATGQSNLPYQVAPGLSEAPKDFYSKLDFEAAKVAYLVDGDSGGSILKKALAKAGVPKRLITTLDVAGIENILSDEAYRAAVTALLPECNPDLSTDKLPELAELPTDVSWSEAVATWCEQYKLQSPSKIAVANWLVENGKAEPSADGSVKLVALHVAMMEIFSLG